MSSRLGSCGTGHSIEVKLSAKQTKKGIPQAQLSNELTALKSEQPWLYDFDSQSLQPVLKNLKQAYQNHFNPSMRAGFPKRKTKKNAKQSFRIPLRLSF